MRVAVVAAMVVLAGIVTAGLVTAKDPGKGRVGKKARDRHASVTEGLDCGNCHTPAGWTMAGKSSGTGFDHSRTGFPLTGRHKGAACNQCHDGERQVKRQCTSCHQDPHQARLSQQCDSCHSSRRWTNTQPFDIHRKTRFPLTGMHALADCTECHRRTGERQWTTVPSDCFACHASEYLDPTVHPSHRGTATSSPFPRDCSLCHRASNWSPAFADPTMLGQSVAPLVSGLGAPDNHDLYFRISSGPHRQARCASCHVSSRSPRLVQCVGCHAHNPVKLRSQHRRRVSTNGASCLGCHPGGTAR